MGHEAPWPERLRQVADGVRLDLDAAFAGTDAAVVVVDTAGRIVAHDRRWVASAQRFGLDPAAVGVGVDYLAVCDAALGAATAREAAAGIRAVLRSERRHFMLDYPLGDPDARRWFTLRASHLSGPGSGAILTHVEVTGVRDAEVAVRAQAHRLWTVVDPDADFAFLLDAEGVILERTDGEPSPFQWPLAGDVALDFVHRSDRERIAGQLADVIATAATDVEGTFRAKHPDEQGWRHFRVRAKNFLDDPSVGGIVVSLVDITARLRAGAAESLASAVAEELLVAALVCDDAGIVTAANAGAGALIGVRPDDLLGRPLRDHVAPLAAEQVEAMRAARAAGEDWSGELAVCRPDGSQVPVRIVVLARTDPATGVPSSVFLAVDTSEEERLRASLFEHDRVDPLTGLPNRAGFIRRLDQLVRSLPPGATGAVAKVSLDRFRDVNDVHGSEAGDAVLRSVGAALREWAGPDALVGRVYGDVFAVAVPPERATPTFGDELRAAIRSVPATGQLALGISASVGVRPLRGTDADVPSVMDDTLAAVTEAKQSGGGMTRWFDDRLRRELRERAVLRSDLAGAVERGELAVDYQPVVRIDDGTVVGAEALVRWHHPDHGLLSPDRFIPLAEQTGVVHEIGLFVLEEACRAAVRWRDLRPERPFSVAVNLSAAQLGDASLADQVRRVLERHQLDPSAVTFELTESMVMESSGRGREQMARLKAVGVRLAIDDFGTGFSSLARLKELPLDVVKIDRTFVQDLESSTEDVSIVGTIVSLAAALGFDVVAEGVEDVATARMLRSVGCTLGQGYLWSAPGPAALIDELVEHPVHSSPGVGPLPPARRGESTADALRAFRHELATPLAVLNMSLATRDAAGAMPAEVVAALERSVHRMSRLIESLDLVDHLDRGTLRPVLEPVDLSELVRSVAAEVGAYTGRQIELDATGAVSVEADPPLLEVVVANLLTNALKYSPAGAPVRAAVAGGPAGARIEVHDVGPGIPPERVGTIWRKFGRLDHGVAGSGLGLFLARGIARAHGGDVRYRPGSPTGSVFVIELPSR